MQLIHVFEILLLAAIVAGILMPWDPRAGKERRRSNRGGRRSADGAAADMSEPTSN
jgi:hypothetical protein